MVKLSYLWGNQKGSTAGANDATQLGAGYVYLLSKRTALYAHASYVDNDGSAVFVDPRWAGGECQPRGAQLLRRPVVEGV